VQESIYQDLASLLANTQELLACAEPSLMAWQDYTLRRTEVFQRLRDIPTLRADSVADSTALQRLIASVLEQDEFLMRKIRQHLSIISHEMIELADRRRLFNAYVLGAQSPRSGHLHTA
jgi:hypothetical protein